MDNLISKVEAEQQDIPLLVGLSGTLISTDTTYEMAVLYVKKNPWMVFMLLVWLLRGKSVLAKELSMRTALNIDNFPYRLEILDYLKQQHLAGRTIILYTHTWIDLATLFSQRFPFIDDVVASDDKRSLTESEKLRLAEQVWGPNKYDYIGNFRKGSSLWLSARHAIILGEGKPCTAQETPGVLEKYFQIKSAGLRGWLKAIRIHQWAKNALLFVPLLMAQKLSDIDAVFDVLLAFISFGVCASATYLLNDLLDLESDRAHCSKKYRPLASGLIGIPQAVIAIVALMSIGLFIAVFWLNIYFLLSLLTYLLLTVLYSFKLKSLQTVDVIVLASLFTLRVIAGGVVISVELSFWLLCFSMFLFLSLAMVKRVSELISVEKSNQLSEKKISGRGYFTADIVILQSLGGAAGFIAVLVFALYINNVEVTTMYHHPQILWLICPMLGYWIMRVWMLTARDEMDQDPISFAITDKNSWMVAALILCALAIASYL